MKIKCIHFGDEYFYPKRFTSIENREGHPKPKGGMWCSPVDTDHGWKDFCIDEQWGLGELMVYFKFTIESDKILVIDTENDLKKMPWKAFGISSYMLPDFEKMALQYDAIYLTNNGERKTRYSKPYDLYGWDCESIIVMNPAIISGVKSCNEEPEELEKWRKKVQEVIDNSWDG